MSICNLHINNKKKGAEQGNKSPLVDGLIKLKINKYVLFDLPVALITVEHESQNEGKMLKKAQQTAKAHGKELAASNLLFFPRIRVNWEKYYLYVLI